MTRKTGRTVTKATLAAMAVVALAIPSSAQTKQLNATEEPTVTGPLESQSDDCRRQHESAGGQRVATGEVCFWIYSYDPGAETDGDRNYGVGWLQATVNSSRGWCVSNVRLDIDLPEGMTVEERTPKTMDVGRRKNYTATIASDAGGSGSEATLEQELILYPRRIRTWRVAEDNIARFKWIGLKDEKLAFVSAAEFSWLAADVPEENPRYGLLYEIKRGDC